MAAPAEVVSDEPLRIGSEIVLRSTIESIVAHRDRAIELWGDAFRAIEAAHQAVMRARSEVDLACQGKGEGFRSYVDAHRDEIRAFDNAVQLPDAKEYAEVAQRLTDLQIWAALVEMTKLEALMDHQAKGELREQMAYKPERREHRRSITRGDEKLPGLPPVTVETVYQTLAGFAENAGTIFKRGLANAFAKLDRRFRSHDGFKIGSRMILTHCCDSWGYWSHYGHTRDTLIDVERVFAVLDGKEPVDSAYAGIVGKIEAERRGGSGKRQSVHEGDYFRVRIFQNGNAHLWFTRDDLVEQANKILADHYSIGDGPDRADDPEAPLKTRAVGQARNLGWFPTPPAVVERVFERFAHDLRGKRVLEPSAGEGALAIAAAKYGARVDCVELDQERAAKLNRAGFWVHCGDFLQTALAPIYDVVIMNPPFDRGRDVDHVWHAWQTVKPGGWLTAIMSAGTEFRSDAKTTAFREAMNANRAQWLDLPAGSFAPATYVNTLLLVVQKRCT